MYQYNWKNIIVAVVTFVVGYIIGIGTVG